MFPLSKDGLLFLLSMRVSYSFPSELGFSVFTLEKRLSRHSPGELSRISVSPLFLGGFLFLQCLALDFLFFPMSGDGTLHIR